MTTPIRTVALTSNERGASVSKFLLALRHSGSLEEAKDLADSKMRSTPQVSAEITRLMTRAAVGSSTTVTDAAPYGIGHEAFLLLQSSSILGRLAPSFRRVPWRVKSPKETGSGGSGSWRGEGLPAPSLKTTTDTFQMDYMVSSVIVATTKELFQFGNNVEATLRRIVIAAVARWVDAQLLDPTVASSASHPASVTHGANVVTSSGSTAANIITDLSALIALIESPGDSLFWLMRPLTLATINARLAGVGYPTTPGFLLGIPTIVGSTSPRQITLVDAENIAYASDDMLSLDVSQEATLEMSDAPSQSGVSGGGSQAVSLFQTGLVAIKADLAASWQHIHYGTGSPTVPVGAAYMVVSY